MGKLNKHHLSLFTKTSRKHDEILYTNLPFIFASWVGIFWCRFYKKEEETTVQGLSKLIFHGEE